MHDFDLGTTLRQGRRAAIALAKLSGSQKDQALKSLARALKTEGDHLLEANTLDLELAREGSLAEWVVEGMKLTPERLQRCAHQVETLAQAADPIGLLDQGYRQDNGLMVTRQRIPLGLIALLYEIYPEFAILGMSMALKTGNSLMLACHPSLLRTHQAILHHLGETVYTVGIPESAIQSVPLEGAEVEPSESPMPLLQQPRYLDLVIPLGRIPWVDRIVRTSQVPVLRTHLGHGHLYIDASASWPQVEALLLHNLSQIAADSLPFYQVITLWMLIHQTWAERHVGELVTTLTHQGFALQVGPAIRERFPHLEPIKDGIDSNELPHLRLQQVSDLSAAIAWINKQGHEQPETILADSQIVIQRFVQEVNSCLVYVNSSPLASRPGSGIPMLSSGSGLSLGTSVQRLHARGPIELAALTTTKYVVLGNSF
ncbi:MAG: gamma-glutamyl phosphate reductase [Cyanobacteriota bacterium]|nr:gamma-glutamyl phosphate reductase [Cyanobacteriota bacterium]